MMRPPPRITFPKTLFVITLFLLTLFKTLPNFIQPTHDDPLEISLQTHHFTYRVSTYTNTLLKRCALIRCGSQYETRLYHHSTCDIVFADVVKANFNSSFRLCPIDYIYTQWSALSKTYNDGIFFISNDVKLSMLPTDLPLDARAVHFAASKNTRDMSITWFAVKPSHLVKPLFEQWYEATDNENVTLTSDQKDKAPELATLNHVRTCKSSDVVCHARSSSIAWQCDSVRNEMTCMAPAYPVTVIQQIAIAVIIIIVFSTIVGMVAQVIPRARGFLGTPLNAHLVSLKFTHILVAVLIFGLAGEDWTFIVKTFSRIFGVSYKHDLQHEVFSVPGEVYRAIPELRGLYSGYSYVFGDNEQVIRITGPGVSLVVGATSVILFLKRVLYGGLLVNGVGIVLLVRLGCELILKVTGLDKTETSVEDDEYIRHRSDLPAEVKQTPSTRGERASRSFLAGRERMLGMGSSSGGTTSKSS